MHIKAFLYMIIDIAPKSKPKRNKSMIPFFDKVIRNVFTALFWPQIMFIANHVYCVHISILCRRNDAIFL